MRGTVVKSFMTGVAAVMRIVKVGFDYFFVIVPRGTFDRAGPPLPPVRDPLDLSHARAAGKSRFGEKPVDHGHLIRWLTGSRCYLISIFTTNSRWRSPVSATPSSSVSRLGVRVRTPPTEVLFL